MLTDRQTTRRALVGLAAAGLGLAASTACAGGLSRAAGPLGAASGAPTSTPAPAVKPPIVFVALGASDTVGVGVDQPDRDGWVPVLSRSLPQPTRLVNLGIPGIKLHEAIEVELPPALEVQPNLITIWLVVNDLLGGVPLPQYTADLNRLLRDLRDRTKAVIAVGNLPDAPEQSRYLGMAAAERHQITGLWNEAIAATVLTHNALLIDLFGRWPVPQHPEYIGPDGLHPTVPGYRTLAETFLAVLREQRVV